MCLPTNIGRRMDRSIGSIRIKRVTTQFACFGLASFADGTFHGFSTLFSQTILQGLWKLTVHAIGLASFFLLTGTLRACLGQSVGRFTILTPYVPLIVYVLWMATHD